MCAYVRACVLVLVLVVACGGADGNGCSAVDAAAVEGVGALAVAAAAVSAGVCVVGVERAGGVDDAVPVPVIVAVTVETRGRRGVSDVGGDVGIAVAVASGSVRVVVEARGQRCVSDVGGVGLSYLVEGRRVDALDVQEKECATPHWRILSQHKEWQRVCRLNAMG